MPKCTRICSVTKLCLTLCNPVDCSQPGSFVHGISQVRILEGFGISSSRGSSWPKDWIPVFCIAGSFFLTTEPLGKPMPKYSLFLFLVLCCCVCVFILFGASFWTFWAYYQKSWYHLWKILSLELFKHCFDPLSLSFPIPTKDITERLLLKYI